MDHGWRCGLIAAPLNGPLLLGALGPQHCPPGTECSQLMLSAPSPQESLQLSPAVCGLTPLLHRFAL